MLLVLLIVLLILAVGGLPPLNLQPYGWGPSGILSLVLVVVLILLLIRLV
jgi:Protein of unknown function (DUF3309)